jgi:hypothetical protein
VSCRLELEIVGRPDCGSTRLVLQVDRARAAVSAGGSGAVRIEQRALTGWYAGSLAMSRATVLGLVQGEPHDIEVLGQLAGDRSAWLPEHF